MSSKVIPYLLIIMYITGSRAVAQPDGSKSYSGGNNVVDLPTASTFPNSEFKFQMGRLKFIEKSVSGLTSFDLTGGLSSNAEFYLRLSLENTGEKSINSLLGYGGKLVLPFNISPIKSMALWSELIQSPSGDSQSFLPQNIFHGAVATDFDILRLETSMLTGITKVDTKVSVLSGIGLTAPINNTLKLGAEVIHNYYGKKETQTMICGKVRLISNIAIQLNSGYISSSSISGWLYSIGVSFTTADIDFSRKIENLPYDIVPSFDDIEKESLQKNKEQ